MLFQSDWSHAAGSTRDAVTDGGAWPLYDEFSAPMQLLTVVAGMGPTGGNALRVQQRGEHSANLQKPAVTVPGTDYRVTLWMRNDDTSAAGDHVVTPDIYKYPNLTYVRKFSTLTDWHFSIGVLGDSPTGGVYIYPVGYWTPTGTLQHGAWYELQWDVHFTDQTHMQVRPRIFNAKGALLFDATAFSQSNPGQAAFGGRNDWTLDRYYAAGLSFCVDPQWLTTFGLGNNGQAGATDTGLCWYFAKLTIETLPPPDPVPAPMSGALGTGNYPLPPGSVLTVR